MVNIVHIAIAIVKVHYIVDRSHNVLNCDMDRNKLMVFSLNGSLDFVCVFAAFKYFAKNRIVNLFLNAELLSRKTVFSNERLDGNRSV